MTCPIPAGFHALPVPIVQLSLAAVLKCGQSFRWHIFPLTSTALPVSGYPTHEYRFCLRDRVVCLRQSSEMLFYRAVFPPSTRNESLYRGDTEIKAETVAWIRDYFQLDIDLVKLYDDWARRDSVFCSFKERFEGIRMLRQDPWENLISFICSSNNNISRITKMVKSLCEHFSPPLLSLPPPAPYPQPLLSPPLSPSPSTLHFMAVANTSHKEENRPLDTYHPFPPPHLLSSPSTAPALRALGFGYRAEYVQKTAKMLIDAHSDSDSSSTAAEKYLESLRASTTDDARTILMGYMGVGRKVADCVLLMSLDKKEVIPVDTHVHQIAIKHYGLSTSKANGKGKIAMTPKIYDQVNTKLAEVWGEYAGWAHSVLFTADLKSFATYGLPPIPSSTVIKNTPSELGLLTPPLTPSPSPTKRKRASKGPIQVSPTKEPSEKTTEGRDQGDENLAERVKKRKRVVVKDRVC